LSERKTTLGGSIRALRQAARLSQDALAEAVGVHRPAVSNWERDVHEPTAKNLEDIAVALGTTVAVLRSGAVPEARATRVREIGPQYEAKIPPRIPPRAYQLVYEYCTILEAALVPEETIEEARRLMSGETFNTLRKHMADERTEDGWVKDVKAAWAFIKDSLKAQGFDL
jgi:transcriptional regulator with XRE-family HTH domain